jgi:hypothetical protein
VYCDAKYLSQNRIYGALVDGLYGKTIFLHEDMWTLENGMNEKLSLVLLIDVVLGMANN